MLKLTVTAGNVWSTLSDWTPELERHLSVLHDGYFFSTYYKRGLWDGKTHFLKIPSLRFPTGLIFMVQEWCEKNSVEFELIDQRIVPQCSEDRPLSDSLQGIVLRDYQIDAIESVLKEKRGVIEAPTASGKTEIAAGIIKQVGLKTLFLVHTKDLLHQTIERFEKRLQVPIGCAGDGVLDVNDKSVVVATVQTLSSLLKSQKAETERFLLSFQIFFLDECHHSSAASWERIGNLTLNAGYRIGLSGTILKRDELSNVKMLALFGPPIYRKKASELAEMGFLSPIEITVVDNPEVITNGTDYQQIYAEGVVRSKQRNELIARLAEKHFSEGKKVMVLVRQIEHGNRLKELISVPVHFLYGATGSNERQLLKEAFNRDGQFVMLASTIFDEGVDIPEINVLIIAAGGVSEVKTIQRIGRGLRKKKDGGMLLAYDFLDHSKYLRQHSLKRFKTYREENFLK